MSAFVAPESECSMFVLIIYEVDFSCFENMDMKVNSENGNNTFGSPHKLFSDNKIILFYCGRQEEHTIIIYNP